MLINWLAFILISLAAAGYTLSQALVLPEYRPISLKTWVRPGFTAKAYQQLFYKNNASAVIVTENREPSDLTVVCQPNCFFNIISRKDNRLMTSLPAIVDVDAAARLTDLQLQFYDDQIGLIGYQTKTLEPMFYVLNLDGVLLQSIQLDLNHTRRLEFVEYRRETQKILFSSSSGEQWLYRANEPALELL